MTDKKKPTIQFGDYSKDFLEAFEKETERLIAEQKGEKKQPEPKKLDEQEQKELLESLKQLDEVERNQPKPISESKMNEYLTTLRDIDAKQRNIDSRKPVTEGDLLGGTDNPVTQSQLRQATGELYARIQTSLASVGGGGIGTIMQGVQGSPQDGQLPMYNDSSGKMVWATVFGVGEAYSDSDALSVILDTVDSAYVQARQTGAGLDSTQVINLITGTVDSDYVAARDSDILSSAYTTADHDSDTLVQVDSAYIAARLPDLYDTPDHDSDTLVQVDSAYVQQRQFIYGDADVRELLSGDSGVFNIIPAADSTYDLGDSNIRWRDLWLSGNTIHLGSQALQSRADGVYANGKKLGFADSAYTTADHDSDTLVQVDSAYVAARLPDLYDTPDHDSDTLVQVDSAYVQQRQIRTLAGLDDTQIDSATIATDDFLQWNGTDWIAAPFNVDPGLEFNGSIDATVGGDSAPSASGGALYVNSTAGVVGASYAGIAGDSIDASQAIAYAESDGLWYILGNIAEASVVEVRQGNGISIDDSNPARPFVAINRTVVDTWYLDSTRTIAMIDSEYVNLRADHYTTADHDSDTLVLVDSAYVQARQLLDSGGLDSAKVVAIIDSYVDSAFVAQHHKVVFADSIDPDGYTTITDGQLWFNTTDFSLAVRDSGAWSTVTAEADSGLDSQQVVQIIDSYADSFYIADHWRALENRFVPIIGMSTQTQGLKIADSFQVNRGEMYFGSNSRIYINQTEVGDFIVDSSLEALGTGNTQKLEQSNGTYISVGGTFGVDLQIWRTTDYESGVWTSASNIVSHDSTGILYQVKGNGSGNWVATGHKRQVLYSTDDGVTWDTSSSSATDFGASTYIFEILWDGSKWSIYGERGGIMTSTDGSSWTSVTNNLSIGSSQYIKAAYYDTYNGRYVIGSTDGKIYHTQDDTLQSWTQATNVGTTDAWYDVVYENVTGTWTIFGDGGRVVNTVNPNDFTQWNNRTVGSENFRQAAMNQYNDIIAVGFNETVVISTDAGVTFSPVSVDLPTGINLYAVLWDNAANRWVFASSNRRLFYQVVEEGKDGIYFDNGDSDARLLTNQDSAWIERFMNIRQGTTIAGGRFIVNSSFTHDSSDVTPTRFVKNLFGIRNIVRDEAGLYTLTFDNDNDIILDDSYSYIVTASIDYNEDNPTASTRNVAVFDQDSSSFSLLMERADDGVNQDYGDNDGGARINFTVTKA